MFFCGLLDPISLCKRGGYSSKKPSSFGRSCQPEIEVHGVPVQAVAEPEHRAPAKDEKSEELGAVQRVQDFHLEAFLLDQIPHVWVSLAFTLSGNIATNSLILALSRASKSRELQSKGYRPIASRYAASRKAFSGQAMKKPSCLVKPKKSRDLTLW